MIYCVEDDSSIRDLMVYALRAAGFSAVGCADGEEFWQAMHRETPELVILDIMLPGEDGISILKKLRAAPVTADIPVIMATAKGTEYDRVIGGLLSHQTVWYDGNGLPHSGSAAPSRPQVRSSRFAAGQHSHG